MVQPFSMQNSPVIGRSACCFKFCFRGFFRQASFRFLDFPGGGIDVRSSLSGESGKIAGGEAD
ncbi:MAG TPA: hypothetical protein PLD51_00090 [Pontiellaceae bacterium]|nr:hypothetical protein [Pontiellaceae bacterium]HPR82230.1 hypothetical protein [Pontiellaceae bacterium]